MKINPYLSPSTKLKSKCIKDLNIKSNTLNLTEEKAGRNIDCIDTGDNFLNTTTIVQALINKWFH